MSKARYPNIYFMAIFFLGSVLFFPFLKNVEGKEGQVIPFYLDQAPGRQALTPDNFSQQVEDLLFQKTNAVRMEKNRSLLQKNPLLIKLAKDRSQDMLERNYLSHFSPEGKSVVDWMNRYQKKPPTSLGENIHMINSVEGLRDPKAVAGLMMEDWMHSDSHRKNILSKKFVDLGVGCFSDGKKIYCAQVFSGSWR